MGKDEIKGTLLVMLGGVMWGAIALFSKTLSGFGFTVFEVGFMRMLVAAIVFLTVFLIKRPEDMKVKLKDLWLVIINGVLSGVLFNFFYFYAIEKSSASVAGVLMFTSPIFVLIWSMILYKEKLNKRRILAIILTISGCACISGIFGDKNLVVPTVAIITGILSGFTYGTFTVVSGVCAKKYSTLTINVYAFIAGTVSLVPFVNLKSTMIRMFSSAEIIPWAIGIGVCCSVVANFSFTKGLKYISSSKSSILSATEPVVAAIIGILVFKEEASFLKILGVFLVVSAIFVLEYKGKKYKNY